jgi:hypothetical protein
MKFNASIEQAAQNLIHHALQEDMLEWPPTCSLWAYQPQRPKSIPSQDYEKSPQTTI